MLRNIRMGSDSALIKPEIECFTQDSGNMKVKNVFRIGTYNILSSRLYHQDGKFFNPETDASLSWEFRKDLVVEAIQQLDIDILGLQEVRPDQFRYLLEKLPSYNAIAFSEHCGKS